MQCKCGGALIRIAVDCYQCNICGLKQAIGFLSMPTEVKVDTDIDTGNSINENYIKQIEKNIFTAMLKRLKM